MLGGILNSRHSASTSCTSRRTCAGVKALQELEDQTRAVLNGQDPVCNIFPHQIAFNCIPQIPQSAAFEDDGYSTEEIKMIKETKKK